jgi:hypothetical protein
MASPGKKPKLENLTDHLTTAHENIDTQMKCGIYHASKKENEEAVKQLEKCRRILHASFKKSSCLINDMKMKYNATFQENASLSSRNTLLFRENSSLKERVKLLRDKVRTLSTLLGETLDDSLCDDPSSYQDSESGTSADASDPTTPNSKE